MISHNKYFIRNYFLTCFTKRLYDFKSSNLKKKMQFLKTKLLKPFRNVLFSNYFGIKGCNKIVTFEKKGLSF
jgi:hypothetical protein